MDSSNLIETVNSLDKKMRKPTLPAKYSKFMQFGFWLLNQLHLDEATITASQEKLCLFDTIEAKTAFYQSFLDQSKEVNKTIRKVVSLRTKTDKKAKVLASKEKKPRKTSTKKDKNPVNSLVSELLIASQATTLTPTIETSTETPTETPT
jgi:hypothetical protein